MNARDTSNNPQDLRTDTSGRLLARQVDAAGADLSQALNTDSAALVTLTAASTGGNSADQTNLKGRGLQLRINVSAVGGTPTLTVTVQGKDPVSNTYYTLLASAGLTTTGFTLLTVYPGIAEAANVKASQVLPLTWRVLYTITGGTPSVTATVSAGVIL